MKTTTFSFLAPVRKQTNIGLFLAAMFAASASAGAGEKVQPWPAPVTGWKAPEAGEHPRLFFRKADLPGLKKRAETPEGKAILARPKVLLGGGEAMPTVFNDSKKAYEGKLKEAPIGTFTLWHGSGFGLLYQLTGEKKYADLGRQCVEKAFAGQVDRDDRYGWTAPGGALRAGPSIGTSSPTLRAPTARADLIFCKCCKARSRAMRSTKRPWRTSRSRNWPKRWWRN